jgi:hypothetical protein
VTYSETQTATQRTSERQETPVEAPRAPYGLDDLMALEVTTGAVSPAMAKHMRETMHFERQRPISMKNVQRLAKEMSMGWFLSGTPIFICVLPDGRKQIVNGNHTLEAVTHSGVTIPLTMIWKQVRGIEDVARCYATFDIQKTRTWMDTLQAVGYSGKIPEVGKVVSALSLVQMGFANLNSSDYTSRQARLQMLPDYTKAAYLLHGAMEGAPAANQKIIRRAAFFSVALYTARYQPIAAEEFWGGLAKDDGLTKNDPRKALLRFGVANRAEGGLTQRVYHAKGAMLAWNAFFENRSLEFCRPASMLTARILGTPMHKGAAE